MPGKACKRGEQQKSKLRGGVQENKDKSRGTQRDAWKAREVKSTSKTESMSKGKSTQERKSMRKMEKHASRH